MKKVIFILFVSLLINPIVYSQDNGIGVIKITFESFPYLDDPAGVSYNSYDQLQNIAAYTIRIYPDSAIESIYGAVKTSKELSIDVSQITYIRTGNSKYGKISVESPRGLYDKGIESFLLTNPLEIWCFNKNLPPYIDIPAPAGVYYLEYSLYFGNARKTDHRKVHPNYPGRSGGDNSVRWGPPKIIVKADFVTSIKFSPTNNINFYQYPDPKEGDWENSPAFWDWIKYLLWTGEWK